MNEKIRKLDAKERIPVSQLSQVGSHGYATRSKRAYFDDFHALKGKEARNKTIDIIVKGPPKQSIFYHYGTIQVSWTPKEWIDVDSPTYRIFLSKDNNINNRYNNRYKKYNRKRNRNKFGLQRDSLHDPEKEDMSTHWGYELDVVTDGSNFWQGLIPDHVVANEQYYITVSTYIYDAVGFSNSFTIRSLNSANVEDIHRYYTPNQYGSLSFGSRRGHGANGVQGTGRTGGNVMSGIKMNNQRELQFNYYENMKLCSMNQLKQNSVQWLNNRFNKNNNGSNNSGVVLDCHISDNGVFCPCGATDFNNEEDIFVQCEICRTWQHCKHVGYYTMQSIPKTHLCPWCSQSIVGWRHLPFAELNKIETTLTMLLQSADYYRKKDVMYKGDYQRYQRMSFDHLRNLCIQRGLEFAGNKLCLVCAFALILFVN